MKRFVEITLQGEDSSFAEITTTDEVVEALREIARQINEDGGKYAPGMKLRVDGMEEDVTEEVRG